MISAAQINAPLADTLSMPTMVALTASDDSDFAELLSLATFPDLVAFAASEDLPTTANCAATSYAAAKATALPPTDTQDQTSNPEPGKGDGEDDLPPITGAFDPLTAPYPSIVLPWPNSAVGPETGGPTTASMTAATVPTPSGMPTQTHDGDTQQGIVAYVAPVFPATALGVGSSGLQSQFIETSVKAERPDQRVEQGHLQGLLREHCRALEAVPALMTAANRPPSVDVAIALQAFESARRHTSDKLPGTDLGDAVSADVCMGENAAQAPNIAGAAAAKPTVSGPGLQTPPNLSELVDSHAAEIMRASSYLDDLVNDIMAARAQQSGARFNLSTEMLGQVGVAIESSDHGLSVQITARGDEPSAVVATAQPRLHDELRAQGVRVSEQMGQSLDRQTSGERGHWAHRPAAQSHDAAPEPECQSGEPPGASAHRFA